MFTFQHLVWRSSGSGFFHCPELSSYQIEDRPGSPRPYIVWSPSGPIGNFDSWKDADHHAQRDSALVKSLRLS